MNSCNMYENMARKKIRRVALRANRDKVSPRKVAGIKQWIERQGVEVTLLEEGARGIEKGADLLVVLGGDGTLLWCARAALTTGVSILGINYGELGFLSEVEAKHAVKFLRKVLDGRYALKERMAIECKILRRGERTKSHYAINDVVVSKRSGRLLRLKARINGEYFHEFPGDGLIMSTSTGSTAYSLSAGGPIVSPALDVVLLTPICPHTLFARSIVTAGSDEISVEVPADRSDVILTIDGQIELPLNSGDEVVVRRARHRVKFVRVQDRHFYSKVRDKFKLT